MQKEVNILLGLDLVPYITKDFLDSLSKKNSELGKDFHFNFRDDISLKPNEYSIEINGWQKAFVFEKSVGEEKLLTEIVGILQNVFLLKPVLLGNLSEDSCPILCKK